MRLACEAHHSSNWPTRQGRKAERDNGSAIFGGSARWPFALRADCALFPASLCQFDTLARRGQIGSYYPLVEQDLHLHLVNSYQAVILDPELFPSMDFIRNESHQPTSFMAGERSNRIGRVR